MRHVIQSFFARLHAGSACGCCNCSDCRCADCRCCKCAACRCGTTDYGF